MSHGMKEESLSTFGILLSYHIQSDEVGSYKRKCSVSISIRLDRCDTYDI